jgi:uncharacterized membrane protein YeaQ/YmgE (transglycosylase-associated protein family)
MAIAVGILAWLCFGLVAGGMAYVLAARRGPIGGLVPISLGVIGAFIGGFLGWLFTDHPLHPMTWVLSIAAAVLTAAAYVFAAGKRTDHPPKT